MRISKKELLIEVIVFMFVVLFLYTAASKLTNYDQSIVQMRRSPVIADFAPVLAWVVPVVELVVSILLVFNGTKLLGLYASYVLMILFTSYIIAILLFSKDVPCSCGGIISALTWRDHLIVNTIFIVLGAIGFTLRKKYVIKNVQNFDRLIKQEL